MESEKEVKTKARVWCRDCGEEMKQYPLGILAFSCRKCKLKATVEYQNANSKGNLKTITQNPPNNKE